MKRIISSFVVLVAVGCSEDPAVAAKAHNIFVSTGLAHQNGVLLGDKQAVTLLGVFDGIDEPNVKDSEGAAIKSKIAKHDADLGLALVLLAEARSEASIGESVGSESGATVTTYLIEPDGTGKVVTGQTFGIRYHVGRAYLETNLDVEKRHYGAGVYSAEGKAIGLVAFELGKRTYVYPMEYVANAKGALTGHHELRRSSGGPGVDSEVFAKHRAQAERVTDPLPDPLTKDAMPFVSGFSKTALVGELTVLTDKGDAPHKKPVKFSVAADDGEGNREELSKGTIAETNLRWHVDAEAAKTLTEQQSKAFGAEFVAKEIAPYEMGYLRYRVPYAPFCPKIKDGRSYVLVVELADGRKSDDLAFRDLRQVCDGAGGEDGAAMEQAWGMKVESAAPAPAADSGKKKRKKKKKKRR